MPMHIPLTIHRLGLEQHFRLKQEIHHCIDRLIVLVSNFIQVISMGEINEQVGNVAGHVQIGPPEMFGEAFFGQGAEELTERMSWRNLRSHIHLLHMLKTHDSV
jgi:hypothetical protein